MGACKRRDCAVCERSTAALFCPRQRSHKLCVLGNALAVQYSMGMLVACLQLTPIACFTIYSYALIAFASYALYIDFNVKDHICGSKYHIWKFTFLNLMLWIFAAVSYLAWRGGGEGARARATVLIAS